MSALRASILEGDFEAGERLVERKIAHQMGISRGPVRDALLELEKEGLVVSNPHRGATVASFSASDIEEIYELRSLLEGYAARVAVEKATPRDLGQLEDIRDEMKVIAAAGDAAALVEKGLAFHREICRLSGKARLYSIWCSLASQVRLVLILAGQVFFDLEYVAKSDAPIVAAFRKKDPDLAERAIKGHMSDMAQVIIQAMREEE